MASKGDTIEMSGEGTLRLPHSVSGGGSFLQRDSTGNVRQVGTWTAEALLSFESLGPGMGTPPTWEGGHALIQVCLVADQGGMKADAVLEVGCELPGPPRSPWKLLVPLRLPCEAASLICELPLGKHRNRGCPLSIRSRREKRCRSACL